MRSTFQKLFLLMLLTLGVGVVRADYLLWMFDETTAIAEVNGSGNKTISTLVGRGAAEGQGVNALRVAAYKNNVFDRYLTLSETGSSYYSVPTYSFDDESSSYNAGPVYADLGDLVSSSSATVSFMIELGFYDSSEDTWLVMAHSDETVASALSSFINSSEWNMQGTTEWSGANYVVPEPSSALLLVLGSALLALRRRRAPGRLSGRTSL